MKGSFVAHPAMALPEGTSTKIIVISKLSHAPKRNLGDILEEIAALPLKNNTEQ